MNKEKDKKYSKEIEDYMESFKSAVNICIEDPSLLEPADPESVKKDWTKVPITELPKMIANPEMGKNDYMKVPVSALPKKEPADREPVAAPAWDTAAMRITEPEEPYFIGFSVNLSDWGDFADDLTAEECGTLIKSLLAYCQTGKREKFEDRALALFYRQRCDAIDEQVKKFRDAIRQRKNNK